MIVQENMELEHSTNMYNINYYFYSQKDKLRSKSNFQKKEEILKNVCVINKFKILNVIICFYYYYGWVFGCFFFLLWTQFSDNIKMFVIFHTGSSKNCLLSVHRRNKRSCLIMLFFFYLKRYTVALSCILSEITTRTYTCTFIL